MEIKNFKKQEIKSLLKERGLNGRNVFVEHGKKYRLDLTFVEDFMKTKTAIRPKYGVDREQIEWLDSKSHQVQESILPSGVITYQDVDVGVIYPRYHLGFRSFEELNREETLLLLKNLRKAISNNEELLRNGIFNSDFVLKNMLYSGTRVGLIGLDGKYIHREEESSYSRVYSYFAQELYRLLDERLRYQCREKASEYSKLICELRSIIAEHNNLDVIDYPNMLIDDIEKARILK